MGTNNIATGGPTRETILFNAYTLITEQGYHSTSRRQIAEATEITLGGIYNHFESKEEIFTTVLIDYHPTHQVIPAVMLEARWDTSGCHASGISRFDVFPRHQPSAPKGAS